MDDTKGFKEFVNIKFNEFAQKDFNEFKNLLLNEQKISYETLNNIITQENLDKIITQKKIKNIIALLNKKIITQEELNEIITREEFNNIIQSKLNEIKNLLLKGNKITRGEFNKVTKFFKDPINQILANQFVDMISDIFNSIYIYLYFVDYGKYIKHKYGTKKFKVVNPENYVIYTFDDEKNKDTFKYYRISQYGNIDEYYGEIIEDGDNSIFKVDEKNESKFIYFYINTIKNFNNIKNTLIDYYNVLNTANIIGGLNINYFFENLFKMNNNELFINKSYSNIINQIIFSGKFKEFLEFINVIMLMRQTKNYDKYEEYERNTNYFIHNEEYNKLYNKFLEDVTTDKNINMDKMYIKNTVNKFIKEPTIIPILLDGIDNILNGITFIDDYLITIYNSSIILSIQEKFNSVDLLNKKLEHSLLLIDIINFSIKDRNKIKSIIKIKLLFIYLPIYLFEFSKKRINQILFYYIITLLLEGSMYDINKKFVFDNIFGKSYLIDNLNGIYDNIFNKLTQCYVVYEYNGKKIKYGSCAESVLLNILEKIFYKDNKLVDNKLNLINNNFIYHEELKKFFLKYNNFMKLNNISSCQEFSRLISNIKGIKYLNNVSDYKYELVPTFENITKLLIYILTGDNKKKTNEEYKYFYKSYFTSTSYEKIVDSIKLDINGMKCTFSKTHAYIGIDTEHPYEINRNNDIYIYFTLYIRKYYNKRIYKLLSANDKKIFNYLNLDLVYLNDLLPTITDMKEEEKMNVINLFKQINDPPVWLNEELDIIFNVKESHKNENEYGYKMGINTAMNKMRDAFEEDENDQSNFIFTINNIYLFITILFRFKNNRNFSSFYFYLKYNDIGSIHKNIYNFVFDKMMEYTPNINYKNINEYVPYELINFILENINSKLNENNYNKLRDIVFPAELITLNQYIQYKENYNATEYSIIFSDELNKKIKEFGIYNVLTDIINIISNTFIEGKKAITINNLNMTGIKFTTIRPLPTNKYKLYDTNIIIFPVSSGGADKILRISSQPSKYYGTSRYIIGNETNYYKKYIKYKIKYLIASNVNK